VSEIATGRAMKWLAREEGQARPRYAQQRSTPPPLAPWLVAVLTCAATDQGFPLTMDACRAVGIPPRNISQQVSPLVTRGLVRVQKGKNPKRTFFLTDDGRTYLAERTAAPQDDEEE
jgi:hypothetical protein